MCQRMSTRSTIDMIWVEFGYMLETSKNNDQTWGVILGRKRLSVFSPKKGRA